MVRLNVVQIPNLNSSSGASGDPASMPPAIRPQLPWQVNEAGAGSRGRRVCIYRLKGPLKPRGVDDLRRVCGTCLSLPVFLSLSKNGSRQKSD